LLFPGHNFLYPNTEKIYISDLKMRADIKEKTKWNILLNEKVNQCHHGKAE
jgi:hypothetical protein